jgi:hypothetical protein
MTDLVIGAAYISGIIMKDTPPQQTKSAVGYIRQAILFTARNPGRLTCRPPENPFLGRELTTELMNEAYGVE